MNIRNYIQFSLVFGPWLRYALITTTPTHWATFDYLIVAQCVKGSGLLNSLLSVCLCLTFNGFQIICFRRCKKEDTNCWQTLNPKTRELLTHKRLCQYLIAHWLMKRELEEHKILRLNHYNIGTGFTFPSHGLSNIRFLIIPAGSSKI